MTTAAAEPDPLGDLLDRVRRAANDAEEAAHDLNDAANELRDAAYGHVTDDQWRGLRRVAETIHEAHGCKGPLRWCSWEGCRALRDVLTGPVQP